MESEFIEAVEGFVSKAPTAWITAICESLRTFAATATIEFVQQRLPATNNADLAFLCAAILKKASGLMSWESLSWTLITAHTTFQRTHLAQNVELLWSGPSPADQIPARRIDQALYDLIANSKREILLITFAASRIERLTTELLNAHERGVRITLILEFEQTSEGQLSFDAIRAFPSKLTKAAYIYCWPVEKRERNQAGRPGKLHSKLALIDDCALVSSANLTDDAFNRNLELGVLVRSPQFFHSAQKHVRTLIANGTFCKV